MDDKTVLITGANAGIGRATAQRLAALGAHVVMVCRSRERGEQARREIVAETGNARVDLLVADLAAQAEVRRLAAEVRERYPRLDVLINNAAVYTRERTVTPDGIETQFAVNHLAPFLLTTLLLPLLRRSAPARIVNVSSDAHRGTRMNWKDLTGERGYKPLKAYSQSKLANILFTRELARRLEGSGVTANALHPGVIGIGLLFSGWSPLRLLKPFLKKPAQGAETPVHLAASPEVEGVSGAYFRDRRQVEPGPGATDAEAKRLWEESERLTANAES